MNISPSLNEYVRAGRELVSFPSSNESKTTLFVGLYNAAPFWPTLESSLRSQDLSECQLLIADNFSTDDSFHRASTLLADLPTGGTLVRNPVNVGGAGNLFLNLDLVDSGWVTTMHQDDIYFPNHVSTHTDMIAKAKSNTALVATEMATVNSAERISVFPRGAWFMQDQDGLSQYLAHMRFHVAPFPSASFRVSALSATTPSFHNTSFPDTEIVLELLGNWSIELANIQTMAHRENPESESLSLKLDERRYGQFDSLMKHFGGDNFKRILSSVPEDSLDSFAKHLLASMDLRFGDTAYAAVIKLFACERMATSWGYSSKHVNSYLHSHYSSLKSSYAADFLASFPPSGGSQYKSAPPIPLDQATSVGFKLAKAPSRTLRFGFRLLARLLVRILNAFDRRKDIDFKWKR